ncbi:NTF2 fold immunity protein [Salinimicrobium xinjiangense]|uniref:NTF2 fold immunity protein n=1 Tax=Salinimicrobium xinjiangense TaxID=438596 RepID=UPI00041B42B8|nr:NTF2 fold immunity protein [Salinimicrobium xinjiangense]
MKKIQPYLILALFFINWIAFGQETDNKGMTEEQAKAVLNEALSDSALHNVIGNGPNLKDKVQAVEFAELVLFQTYGKVNIEKQKPYSIHNIDGYWLICGNLPKGKVGGTFLIIIDSRNYQIIRLTHGK